MRKHPLKNIAVSVHQRVLNKARETGRPFNELVQYFAMERFLYRLSKSSYAGKFILKGALMFNTWKVVYSRPTKDIDLLGKIKNDISTVVEVIKEVCLQEVEPDGIVFDTTSIIGERVTEDADYAGVRIRLRGSLDTTNITMQIDIGFGDVVVPSAEWIEYPSILNFASPQLRGYSKESIIAEKFEAMVKLGVLNSRMKDFFDIFFLLQQFNFDGRTLASAIMKTFSNRHTIIPIKLVNLTNTLTEDSSKKSQWRAFIRKNRIDNAPEDLRDVIGVIANFLGPIVDAIVKGLSFNRTWRAPGPWLGHSAGDI